MTSLPPLMRDPRSIDLRHLKLLAIFHFVLTGFALLGIGFLLVHFLVMNFFFTNPEIFEDAQGGPSQEEMTGFFNIFRWFYLVMGILILVGGAANLISGFCLLRRKARIFSMVVAGLNCFMAPFGTLLGVVSIIVLVRDSVRNLYRIDASAPPPLPGA